MAGWRTAAQVDGPPSRLHVKDGDCTLLDRWSVIYRRLPEPSNLKSAVCNLKLHDNHASIYLHDEGSREGAPARHQGSRRHLALVLFRRKDWCPRVERGGEKLAAED